MSVESPKPSVLSLRNLLIALAVHLALFLGFYLFAKLTFTPKEMVIPIDLTVVVQENLDGKENEPPPLKPPEVKPTNPLPKPPVETVKPKPVENVKAVETIREKPKPKHKEKPKEKPKDKPKEKTKEQLRQERLAAMRNSATRLKPTEEKRNGKTDKKTLTDAEFQQRLNEGYRAGATTNIAKSEAERCVSLIRNAFYERWNRPAWTSTLKEAILEVQFGAGGVVLGYKLTSSSGDAKADKSVLSAASLVRTVRGLSAEFIAANPTVLVRFKVTPQ